ncbi:hypothetical protein V5O48_013569 [Marasmius crinis-equi]|uniref:CxC2-like cysteine cluster KDZ transposase-associated domain-containing protein n=1 Tax=Marasmius crinis-equi TaxID=585013 RepID=A0ABR3EZQ8_9AGAR
MPRAPKDKQPKLHTTSTSNTKAQSVFHASNSRVTEGKVIVDAPAGGSSTPKAPVESLLKEPSVAKEEVLRPGEELGKLVVLPKKRYPNSDSPLQTWVEFRDLFLDYVLVLEGRGRLFHNTGRCAHCISEHASFRRQTCWGFRLVCKGCLITRHQDEPCHRLEEWKKDRFHTTSMKALKVRYQLGHRPDFIRSLSQMTDGTGLVALPDRKAQWMNIFWEYRHIKMMKRRGRGHDPEGLAKTPLGSATVICRACPHPDRNLPEGWENVPKDDRFLYALFLSEDANFKQKARARPNDSRDPALGPGWGCFVPNDAYQEELKKHQNEREISRRHNFKAMGSLKKSKNLRATGIGSVSCARHETFLPNGMGDLQKGERFCNMDFLALSALMGCQLLMVFFSYDIACQWMINFMFRMAAFPPDMRLPPELEIIFKVPKWHLIGHVLQCLVPFSFAYTEGAGKTDGEAPERCWSWLNVIARSVSMMTAGARWDTMDDFANAWNYRKMINLESSLLRKMTKAIPQAVINARVFYAFTEALKVDHSAELSVWLQQVVNWEQGIDKFCPYEVREPKISLAKVKKKLADEEQQREEQGHRTIMSFLITEGVEIEESQRSLAETLSNTNNHTTTLQHKAIQEKQTHLLKRIRKHRQAMLLHMPLLQKLLDKLPTTETSAPKKMPLFLPSSLHPQDRSQICPAELVDVEDQLRWGQCFDALARLRSQLQARTVAYKDTSRLTPSQGLFTRMQTLRAQIEAKFKAHTATYRCSRNALLAIRGEGSWTGILKELKDEDIQGITEQVLKKKEKDDWEWSQRIAGASEEAVDEVLHNRSLPTAKFNPLHSLGHSKQHLSWIWYTHQSVPGEEGVNTFEEVKDSLQSEWCKARANSRRPREELRLVEEEMRRAIAYCHYQAGWWTGQIGRREAVSPWLKEGLEAYAKEQCDIELSRALHWSGRWASIRARAKEILACVSDPAFDGSISKLESLEIELDLDDHDLDETNLDFFDVEHGVSMDEE